VTHSLCVFHVIDHLLDEMKINGSCFDDYIDQKIKKGAATSSQDIFDFVSTLLEYAMKKFVQM